MRTSSTKKRTDTTKLTSSHIHVHISGTFDKTISYDFYPLSLNSSNSLSSSLRKKNIEDVILSDGLKFVGISRDDKSANYLYDFKRDEKFARQYKAYQIDWDCTADFYDILRPFDFDSTRLSKIDYFDRFHLAKYIEFHAKFLEIVWDFALIQRFVKRGDAQTIYMEGETALFKACSCCTNTIPRECFECIVEGFPEAVNIQTYRSIMTPLHCATRECNEICVDVLLRQREKKQFYLKDRHGKIPLDYAVQSNRHLSIVLKLLKATFAEKDYLHFLKWDDITKFQARFVNLFVPVLQQFFSDYSDTTTTEILQQSVFFKTRCHAKDDLETSGLAMNTSSIWSLVNDDDGSDVDDFDSTTYQEQTLKIKDIYDCLVLLLKAGTVIDDVKKQEQNEESEEKQHKEDKSDIPLTYLLHSSYEDTWCPYIFCKLLTKIHFDQLSKIDGRHCYPIQYLYETKPTHIICYDCQEDLVNANKRSLSNIHAKFIYDYHNKILCETCMGYYCDFIEMDRYLVRMKSSNGNYKDEELEKVEFLYEVLLEHPYICQWILPIPESIEKNEKIENDERTKNSFS